MDWYGYTGNILKVNLTDNEISTSIVQLDDIKAYVGGLGMNCKLATELLDPKIDPLSPNNIVIIGAGPLVGTITPGTSRIVGLTKFPASGAIANSCGSMSFGFHLKNAGFDHIIITGKADSPSYLEIMDDHIKICDAEKIWGCDIVESTDYLREKNGSCGVIAIGQAGESLVKSALTLIDKTSTFGRGGLGAVMGSKNLKAIVAKGTMGVSIANPKNFNKLYNALFERIRNYPLREDWHKVGMLRSLPMGMLLAATGQKKKIKQCSERTYLKKLKRRRIACPSCPMGDKDILEINEGEFDGLINYTSSVINPFMLLSLKDINTYNEAVKGFDLINRYGLDALTIGALLEFCNRLHDEGIFTKENTGVEWKRDYKTLVSMIELMIRREGFGEILADGWKKIAEAFNDIENKMLIVKGLDVIFDPRLLRLGTMEFEQVVNPKGAHVASGGSPTYAAPGRSIEQFKTHFYRMGIPESAINRIYEPPLKEMGLNIGRLTRYSEDWYTILTNVGACARAQMNRFYSLKLITDFYNAVTGLNLSEEDMRKAAERSWNLLKIMNLKAGFSRVDDKFPKEWFKIWYVGDNEITFKDFYGGKKITPEIANQLLGDYYNERGWDEKNGQPAKFKLKELGLEKYCEM